ncbi:MAG: hypothetical protein RBT75_02530 [Anaerolineae bacterium]|jgi:hypothetical protein|nr:hypothetical protein [Anaerolineae bacterium]
MITKRALLLWLIFVLVSCAAPTAPTATSSSLKATVTPTSMPASEPVMTTFLDETPPGVEPVVFRAGSVSTGAIELSLVLHPNLRELTFTRLESGKATIWFSQKTDAGWSAPKPADFSGKYNDVSPFITSDGQRLYFASTRPTAGGATASAQYHIWYVEASAGGWSEPVQRMVT